MKVLIICNSLCYPLVEISGMAAIFSTARQLSKKKDLEIHVLSSLPSWSQPIKDDHLIFHYVKADSLLLIRILFFIKAFQLHSKYKFDIIHDFSSLPALIGFTGLLAKLCGCKSIHNLCTVNEGFLGSEKLIFGSKWVDRVVCSDLITKGRISNRIQNVDYIPLVVDFSKFLSLSRTKNSLKKQRILFLGSLEPRKGAFVLVEAIKLIVENCPEAIFTFASYGREIRDPRYEENLTRLKEIVREQSAKVKFLTGEQDVAGLMASAAIFVLPSISRHGTLGQPLTLLEAMASGKLCVISDIQAGDGLVEDGVNCLLFRSGDPRDLARKVSYLLSNPPIVAKMSSASRRKVINWFDIKRTSRLIYDLYSNLVDLR